MHRFEVAQAIADNRSVAIVRSGDAETAASVAEGLIVAGQRILEISMTTPQALEIIADLSRRFLPAKAIIGVGTVLDASTVRLAQIAGARFVVSPTLDFGVLRAAHRYGLATLPGVASPTEAIRALEAGADFVKLFPASAYGPGSLADLLAACPQLPVVPTGGVTLDNAPDYIRSGAVAVGIGGALTGGSADTVAQRVDGLRAVLHTAR
ncbi:bifunctional 4-hydroxy-2-oxoglutarate aldolase/2-dehydro-3-deoxy-phosphogluconate aldolase [Microbacterium awajiense]|uniref:Bifunctional 4-hydroxy-2-oxoglutarate aldolase/2-dehydro-3-deoxy-phosphogluconate aldolase n=1 Tax=Microbacterium awajiense TaxID=415214 RepID=A0ABP7ATJ9_9MICO